MSSPVVDSPDRPRPAATRRARFRRDHPPPLRLTADDLAILRHVAAHRFLRSTHLVALMNRPAKKIVERLGTLYHNAYLDRPRAQLDYYATAGSAPLVYGLGTKGADRLSEIDGRPRVNVDWTTKNRSAKRLFIEHTLLVANLMIALELAVRRRADLRLIYSHELLEAASQVRSKTGAATRHPWMLTASFKSGGKTSAVKIIPDKVFGLEHLATGKRSYFFVEADRGTMPVRRSHPRQTSFAQKLRVYLAAHATHVPHDRWGLTNFRVLTVTTSRARITSMIEALREDTRGKGSNQFLFIDRASLAATPDVLALDWITGKGATARLDPADRPEALY